MSKGLRRFLAVSVALFCLAGIGAYAEQDAGKGGGPGRSGFAADVQDDRYRQARALQDEGDYQGAYRMFMRLIADHPGTTTYEIGHMDAFLDIIKSLKDSGNPEWKLKAIEAKLKIKSLSRENKTNADYYYIHAKYSWIVEASRDAHIFKALEKAFYYRRDFPEAYLLQGDIYFDRAKNTSPDEQDTTSATGGSGSVSKRRYLAEDARSSYESALASSTIQSKRKASALYRLGELEDQLFLNKETARAYWEKAAGAAPDSRAGRLAKERLVK